MLMKSKEKVDHFWFSSIFHLFFVNFFIRSTFLAFSNQIFTKSIFKIYSLIFRNGSMNTYVKSLAMLLRSDRLFLSDEELNALFNKALNWLHIPSVVESTCIMLKNLLIWCKLIIFKYFNRMAKFFAHL
jgi:hypothetical protein